MTHSFMWRDAFICVTWHVHMCDRVGDHFWSSFWVSNKQHYLSLCVIESLVKNVRVISETSWHCNTLQHTATHCNTGRHCGFRDVVEESFQRHCYTARRCNTLQHTATQGDIVILETLWKSHFRDIVTLQNAATRCNTGRHCDFTDFVEGHFRDIVTLQHAATHCNTLQHTATQGDFVILETLWDSHFRDIVTLQHAATRCNTLQHTATQGDILILETL